MNKTIYKLANIANVPLSILKNLTKQDTIYPFYHTVSDNDIIHIKHLYPIRTVTRFEKDLDFFLKHYTPLDIKDLVDSVKNGTSVKKDGFLLSFDDGLAEFHDVIAPILLRKGIPAVCFLNSGFIDNQDLFFRYKASILIENLANKKLKPSVTEWFKRNHLDQNSLRNALLSIDYNQRELLDELAALLEVDFNDYLKTQKPYMSTNQIQALIEKGFSFGAHSIDHPQYSKIDAESQVTQTKESINEVSSLFNLDYNVFSFPFTDFNVPQKFFDEIFQKDKAIADVTFGCAGLKNDSCMKNIQRIPIEIDSFSAKSVVTGEYFYYIGKAIFNKNIIKRT